MRRVGSWGGTAALVVGLGAVVATAREPDVDVQDAPRGLLSGLFHEKPRARTKAEKPPPVADGPTPTSSPTVETAIAEQQRQMNAVLRRMEVCDRLRMIALQTGNEPLMRRADDLEARARDIYNRQTAQLPIPMQASKPSTKADDEKLTSRPRELPGREADAMQPAADATGSPTARQRLGGNFEQREQSILNDTSMRRDRP